MLVVDVVETLLALFVRHIFCQRMLYVGIRWYIVGFSLRGCGSSISSDRNAGGLSSEKEHAANAREEDATYVEQAEDITCKCAATICATAERIGSAGTIG